MPEPALRLVGIEKHYASTVAVAGIDLDVSEGEFVTLLGPSGCGKTTTLGAHRRILSADGRRDLSEGQAGRRPAVVPARHRRRVPGLRAVSAHERRRERRRSACGCARCRRPKSRSASPTRSSSCSSTGWASGGRCRCRAASGSASRSRARLSSIPPCCCSTSRCRISISSCARRCASRSLAIQRRLGITTVFVTHDQSEALVMSDRIAVMNAGRIEQIGDPADIYERPATRFVAEFIGRMNLFCRAR